MKIVKSIEDETPLMPWIVADVVIWELENCLSSGIGDGSLYNPSALFALADMLADKANLVYKNNPRFRRKIRSRGGREYLYSFMRHWLAGEVLQLGITAPADFANGAPPPQRL